MLCRSPKQIREGVFSFFKYHFKKEESPAPRWDGLQIKHILDVETSDLEVEFSEDKVWKAFGDCDGNKATGPNELNLNFFKKNWEWIKGNFKIFFKDFHFDGSVVKDMNATFIALFPKLKNLTTLKDYRPMSLVGSIYKVFAEVWWVLPSVCYAVMELNLLMHVFLHCEWSSKLWQYCLGWWDVHGCFSRSVNEWVKGWPSLCPSSSRRRVWSILFFAIVWTIWESRNDAVFHGISVDMVKPLDTVKFCLALWFKNHGSGSKMDITLPILDIKEMFVDSCLAKKSKSKVWNPLPDPNFSFFMDHSSKDAILAEVLAIHKACQLIVDCQLLINHNVDIYSDSSLAMSWCNGEDFGNFSLVNFVYDIRQFLYLRKSLTI
ncbi:hypothetical protein Ddye_021878 [Dipteronia dyeriana]|uniref:RNase H type-1 domain-containing protein n=1 Tax=Dipteronia dyeriana TaxID=168575 RepID=A0AAD9WXY5_9ROSI|nr:hypothetical protein Ddye_021878 [Dipteronia dyeriana]